MTRLTQLPLLRRMGLVLWIGLLLTVAACGSDPVTPGPVDGGVHVDAGPPAPIPCMSDANCPATYCNPGSMLCCAPTGYELCGDRIDQNCDHHDTACGDTDRDGVQACTPVQNPITDGCDCDDERTNVRPPFGTLAGAREECDGIDNDCNGRIDESAACCEGCASLGAARDRADICTTDGTCDCTSDPALGPCAEGRTCCSAGCVDVTSDVMNCGFCGAQCTVSADHCEARECRCGATAPCDLDAACTAGGC